MTVTRYLCAILALHASAGLAVPVLIQKRSPIPVLIQKRFPQGSYTCPNGRMKALDAAGANEYGKAENLVYIRE